MKKIIRYLLIAAAAVPALFSCKTEEPFEPGEPEMENCYGVTFPKQKLTEKTYIIEPTDPTKVSLTAVRKRSAGAITVPVEISPSEEGIFDVAEINFADGQDTTEFEVRFDHAEIGKTYVLSLHITDPLYASKYGEGSVACDFSVKREKWLLLGKATLSDSFFFENSYEVPIEQNPQNPLEFRLIDTPYEQGLRAEGYYDEGLVKAGPAEVISFKVLKKGDILFEDREKPVEIDEDGLVYFNPYQSGFCGPYGEVFVVHPFSVGRGAADAGAGKSEVLQWQEEDGGNRLPGVVKFAPIYMMPGAGLAYGTGKEEFVTIVFPGVILSDYSLEMTAGVAEDGKITVSFKKGADVADVKYAIYEGRLTGPQVDKKAKALLDGTETEFQKLGDADAAELSFEQTGIYTMVAVSMDEAGNTRESASLIFEYLAAGDEKPVFLQCGAIVSDKYAADSLTAENSIEVWAYGKDIKKACVQVYKANEFEADQEKALQDLLEKGLLDAEALEKLNGKGWSAVFSKLLPGTNYVVAVYATNGYEETYKFVQQKTAGGVDPTQLVYTVDNVSSFEKDPEDYFRNDYVAYHYDGDFRKPMTLVALEDGGVWTDGKGREHRIIDMTGLWGDFMKAAHFEMENDITKWEFVDNPGLLVSFPSDYGKIDYQGVPLYLNLSRAIGTEYLDSDPYFAYIGVVTDYGDLAFISSTPLTKIDEEDGGVTGLMLAAWKDPEHTQNAGVFLETHDFLLRNPDNMEESAARTAAAARTSARLRDILRAFAEDGSRTADPEARLRQAAARVMRRCSLSKGRMSGIRTEPGTRPASFQATHLKSGQKEKACREKTAMTFSGLSLR